MLPLVLDRMMTSNPHRFFTASAIAILLSALRSSTSARLIRWLFAVLFLGAVFPAAAVDLLVSNFTDSPDPAVRGGNITYSATITNNETDTASNVNLVFTLDADTTWVSNSSACSYNGGTHKVTCSYATVKGEQNGNAADVITATVVVSSKASALSTVTATATVSSSDVDTNPANDSLTQITTIDNGADLNLSITPASATVVAGGTVSYTVSTTNSGPNDAGTVTVTTTLSPNITYQSASGAGWSCSVSGQVVTCTRSSAANGSTYTFTVNGKVTGAQTGTITTAGVVAISGSATDFNSANDNATADVTVTSGTDLAITKTASTSFPPSGQSMTFTLAPRNLGPFAATSVTVTDTLPAGFSNIGASGTGWTCGVSGQTVTCTAASYAVGATNNITITTTAPTVATSTLYTNTASISATTTDPDNSNNSGSVSVTVLPDGVDLSITKSRSPNPVAQGANITNTIRVTNSGPRGALSGEVQAVDTLPAGESYVSYSGTNWTCGAVGQVVTCTYNAALGVGSNSSNLTIITRADNAGTLTNTVCASYTDSGGNGYTDPVAGNNCASAGTSSTVAGSSIDLQVAKSVDVDPLVWNANTLTYTITVTNAGPGAATGVVLTDPIPGYKSGATGVTASKTAGTSNATFNCTTGSTVTCTQTGGTIGAGENAVFQIAVTRPMFDSTGQSGGKFTNTATVTSTDQGDTDTSNNSASVQVAVDPVADLTITNTVTPTSAQAGTNATYVLTVNNNGPSSASNVTVSDVFTLGAGNGTMTFISATPSTGSCGAFNTGTNTLSCSLGTIVSGGTATVTVIVRPDYMIAPPSPRQFVNDATVSSTTQDSNSANNTAQSTLTITQASLDLLVNNVDSPDPLGYNPSSPSFPDNVVTYKNTITNRGPSVASGLVLTYAMTPPAGKSMKFLGDKLSSSGQAYSNYCNNLNSTVTGPATLTITCTFPGTFVLLASNSTTDLYLDFEVTSTPSATGDTFASTVSITSNEPDSVNGNNSVSQTTTVRMRSDLQLAKSARAYIGGADAATTTVQVRQPFYWVLTLTNAGPGDSQVTTLTDTLPSGVSLYTGGSIAPYNASPYTVYNSGAGTVPWSSSTGGSGTCTISGSSISCSLGLLSSGAIATVKIPVVSNSAGTRNNCASATTSEVDPNTSNNTSICSSVTVQQSSIAGTVYSDANNNGAKDGGESGINNVTVALSGTDSYGNTVSSTTTTNASGAFSFTGLSPGTYALTETQPSGYQDGKETAGTAGGTVDNTAFDSTSTHNAITAISLAGNTSATGYLFGELANATLSGYVFIDANTNAVRDGGETTGLSGITMTLTGTDDVGAVNTTTTTGANGSYSFTNLRPGTYQVQEATIAGLTHTGMYVGSKGGNDGATVVASNTAVTGAAKRTISNIAIAAGDTAQNYNFGESGQALSGYVYADLNNNGVKDAGEPGIPGVSVTLSGTTASATNVCVAINPNPCTVVTASDGSYSFNGIPASDGTGYTVTEQSQAAAPLSNYVDGAETVGSLGGSAAVNDVISGIVVGVGQVGTGYNFGEKAASISGTVYHDKNDNGSKDGSDPGISGVTITLSGTTASGSNVCTIISSCTTTTASDGTFSFTGLPAANGSGYTLTETQPTDYAERTNTAGTGGGASSVVGGNSVISGISTAAGATLTGYLFGEKTGTLSGYVYADANNNGSKDGGESGIAGVTVTLSGTTASGANVCSMISSCTATTAADGSYSFANVPNANGAGYTLTEQAQNVAPLTSYVDGQTTAGTNCGACTATTPSAVASAQSKIQSIPFSAASSFTSYNFGELVPASLAGRVYMDINNNSSYDAGEELSGVTLTLTGTDDIGTVVNKTTTTGSDGTYSFTGLRASNGTGYTVTETQPTGYADYAAAAGTQVGTISAVATGTAAQNVISSIVLPLGQGGINYNFRESAASISGTVYLDSNNDGVKDIAESGIANVTLKLTGTDTNGSPVSKTAITGADGTYQFAGLMSGTYTVTETQPAGYNDGKETAGTAGGSVDNSGFDNTDPHNSISTITLVAGATATGYNFGELPGSTAGAIHGRVFIDRNNDGLIGSDETGIAGVTITLTGKESLGKSVSLTTVTEADGTFHFTGLQPSDATGYTLTEIQPTDYIDGKTIVTSSRPGQAVAVKPVAAGGADTITGIRLLASVVLTEYNFGELLPGSISGLVYADKNNNGAVDSGESGIAGVTVTLTGKDYKGSTVSLSTVTAADGTYSFTKLLPSDSAGYAITETQPSSYDDGKTTIASGNPGTASATKPVGSGKPDTISGVLLTAGSNLTGYNFGETSEHGSIAGVVYVDANNNGVQDAGESGIAGVTMTLTGTDIKGAAVNLTTTTAADGTYSFTNLLASNSTGYTIRETQPADYNDGKTTVAAGNPGSASSTKPVAANGADSISGVTLTAGAKLTGYNFGETANSASISGYVYNDANNNGSKDDGEAGISGVTVTLTGKDSKGTAVQRTVTSGDDGAFSFTNLPASDANGYVIVETQPHSYTDGKTTVTSGSPGTATSKKPVNVTDNDVISGVKLTAGGNLTGYLFGELQIPFLKPPIVNGYVWLDRAHDRNRPLDGTVQGMPGWTVQLRQNGKDICTTHTDSTGFYQFDNLHCVGYEFTGLPIGKGFSIIFSKDGNTLPAVPTSGGNKGNVPPTGGMITDIELKPADAIVEQNLPLDPAGIVYDSITRKPVNGAKVTITGPGGFVPDTHLVGGVAAQTQVVGTDGMYQFLLQNDFPSGVYTLVVVAPDGYLPAPSTIIPPCANVNVVGLIPTPGLVQASDNPPASSVPQHKTDACVGMVPGGAPTTQYYFNFNITNGGSAPILNNHIPLDPRLTAGLLVTKTTPLVNVSRGDLVPYTITASNTQAVPVSNAAVQDNMPPGFKYRAGSGRLNGAPAEPTVNGRVLTWPAQTFAPQEKKTYTLVLSVGTGVGEGEYVNQAYAINAGTGTVASNVATATVRIVPDATFDCPDIVGKVFDDRNANGYQDDGEPGIPNVRIATPRGLLVNTDADGRFHVPCADIPNADRGSNFVMKLDERTLPSGYRVTTENPRDVRVTRGKLVKLNFGATIHRVVRIEMSDAAFKTGEETLLPEWHKQIDTLVAQLKLKPSIVRIAYQRGGEAEELAAKRVARIAQEIRERWKALDGMYTLVIETEGAK